MSKLEFVKPHRIEIKSNDGNSRIGTFWELNCEKHGDTLCVTDSAGSDWCMECVKTMLATSGEIKPYGSDIS